MQQIKTFPKGFLQTTGALIITSTFGKRDRGNGIKDHNGIDIAVPVGTVIKCPLDGSVVTNRVEKKGAGLYVTIRHYITAGLYMDIYFMHLSEANKNMIIGHRVSQGDVIGKTGGEKGHPYSGDSEGAHLHLGVKKNGVFVDPQPLLVQETLFSRKNKTIISLGKNVNFVDESALKSQAFFKYTKQSDITVWSETETEPREEPKPQSTEAKERLALGIWQITKVLVDSSVEGKQVCDSSISTQTGSILNFFRKVCQEPLVELMGDTYGNQYYYIVRRPPFDKENYIRLINSALITIESKDVISSSLEWNNSEIYSWYRYIPFGDILGVPEAQLFQPAVFFPEFAAVWGSRPLAIESNYYNYAQSGRWNNDKEEQKENANRIVRNAIRDFKFLVESNAYNAFTRKGTITIMGDRRIKKGTLIAYSPSKEFFYVDSVQNEYSVFNGQVSRTTVLNVSRGMFPDYALGTNIAGGEKSYFNIIDFGKLDSANLSNVNVNNWKDFISSWKVDLNVFNFFMTRQHILRNNV